MTEQSKFSKQWFWSQSRDIDTLIRVGMSAEDIVEEIGPGPAGEAEAVEWVSAYIAAAGITVDPQAKCRRCRATLELSWDIFCDDCGGPER